MLDCFNLARIEPKFSYPLCLSQKSLSSYATDLYFTYICKLSCIFHTGQHDHVYINQSSAVEAWCESIWFSHILNWFDLAHKFDHRSSLRKLNLILKNKTIYLVVFHHDHDSLYFTYTCNLSCLMYTGHTFPVNNNNTTCYIYIYFVYTLFFLFLPLSA